MLQKKDGRYEVYGNPITSSQTRAVDKWKDMLAKKFNYDPNEKFNLSVEDHPYGGNIFGLKTIVRDGKGTSLNKENGVIVSTIRMGFGHYRIAMAGVSAAKAMGFQPYWLDLLSIPGITTDVINWCNTWYSRFSRLSQRSGGRFCSRLRLVTLLSGDVVLVEQYLRAFPFFLSILVLRRSGSDGGSSFFNFLRTGPRLEFH